MPRKLRFASFFACLTLAACASIALVEQTDQLKSIQVPFASLTPSATFKIGENADWVLVTGDSVWVASSKPDSLHRIDPATNKEIAKIALPGNPCAGLASGFGSVWVPLCPEKEKPSNLPSLARVDVATNKISRLLPFGPAAPEGGISASTDSVWIVTGKHGTLVRINPRTNTVRQKITIAPGSYNPLFRAGIIWITGFESNTLIPINATTGTVLRSISVGPKPRFLTAGAGSIWTFNQGDGTLTRVDARTRKVLATIALGTPGYGGDICYGAGSVWTTLFHVPLTRISPITNKPLRQWTTTGDGGDSLRFGFGSIWLTDYHRGLLLRIPIQQP